MSWRWLFDIGRQLGGALLLNLLLLATLMHLNEAEPVRAEPEMVTRLRLPEALPPEPPPRELRAEPEREEPEPLPEEAILDEMAEPEIEPLPMASVVPTASIPVVVRPVPRPAPLAQVRRPAAAAQPPAPRRRPEEAPRMLGSEEVEEPPRDLRIARPRYPHPALVRGIEGSATVKLLIDEHGRVTEVRLIDTRGSEDFGAAVLAVAERWRFTPARHHGEAVRVWALKTVRFRLEDY